MCGVIVNIRCDGDLDVRREFQEFKLQETAKKGKKQREAEVNDLKLFSENLRVSTSISSHKLNLTSLWGLNLAIQSSTCARIVNLIFVSVGTLSSKTDVTLLEDFAVTVAESRLPVTAIYTTILCI